MHELRGFLEVISTTPTFFRLQGAAESMESEVTLAKGVGAEAPVYSQVRMFSWVFFFVILVKLLQSHFSNGQHPKCGIDRLRLLGNLLKSLQLTRSHLHCCD